MKNSTREQNQKYIFLNYRVIVCLVDELTWDWLLNKYKSTWDKGSSDRKWNRKIVG